MDETPGLPAAAPAIPLLPLAPLLQAIADRTRWQILRLLAAGEPLMVKEVARAIGRSETSTAKHLAVLRKVGLTISGRGRLQQISKQFPVDPTTRVLDLAYLQLRLGVEEP
jgi:DNA-binding transcriptional ArsR family regulator